MTDHREIEQLVEAVRDGLRAGQRVAVNDPRRRYRADYFTDALEAADRLATIAKNAEQRAEDAEELHRGCHETWRVTESERRAAEERVRIVRAVNFTGDEKIASLEAALTAAEERAEEAERLLGKAIAVGAAAEQRRMAAEERARELEELVEEGERVIDLKNEHLSALTARALTSEAALATEREARERAERERDEYRAANESARVCAMHVEEFVGEGCLVCLKERAETHADACEKAMYARLDAEAATLDRAERAEEALQDMRAKWEDDLREAHKLRERLDRAEEFIAHLDAEERYEEWLAQDEEEGADQAGAEDPAKLKEAREASDSR